MNQDPNCKHFHRNEQDEGVCNLGYIFFCDTEKCPKQNHIIKKETCIFYYETILDEKICILGNDLKECSKNCKDYDEGKKVQQ